MAFDMGAHRDAQCGPRSSAWDFVVGPAQRLVGLPAGNLLSITIVQGGLQMTRQSATFAIGQSRLGMVKASGGQWLATYQFIDFEERPRVCLFAQDVLQAQNIRLTAFFDIACRAVVVARR